MGILSLVILYPAGNMKAVDVYFFCASASTESGLNTYILFHTANIDVRDLYTYQQLYIYFIPIFTNLGFTNAVVVLVRFLWFRKHLSRVAPRLLNVPRRRSLPGFKDADAETDYHDNAVDKGGRQYVEVDDNNAAAAVVPGKLRTITFDPSADTHPKYNETLHIPGPRDRDRGLSISGAPQLGTSSSGGLRRGHIDGPLLSQSRTMDRVTSIASSIFVIGSNPRRRCNSTTSSISQQCGVQTKVILALSHHATLGRNSEFDNLTKEDREKLGGIEYRSLKLLLKVVFPYFFGLHLFGAVCLVGWIRAFYSAQTMVDNLGFTLTPNSMISFRDAHWPMFIMSFLAFAGNTLYPVFLRLTIWTISKLAPKKPSIQEPLSFLLNHPRRCYTLLFPSRPTWILFGIIFILIFVDTLLIIILDLDNQEVASLPLGTRILAAIFQAASSRHTGTSTPNLANVNPAVQFSLLIMMYIAIFPTAIRVRASNKYEEKSLGMYEQEEKLNESNGKDYLPTHVRNQFSFDLWFIFLGVFCICMAESERTVDNSIPSFTVWTIFFEVTSAYGNVGLSLGYPTVATSLSGMFGTFSKLAIRAVMIRGRHRGLPYALDRAIMLPDEHAQPEEAEGYDNGE
ncbi:trk family potassium uptake [Trichoderma arundinaceum]|uniref:Trk family potassium uptake n=1 Tax=Trichoderma arundinaceum TaxID=490622 RepID=A0A395NQW2_TRIAR|nr:trk family potassium uptake [Trichoderma arundinaceum]